jgi:hypothetical protein
MFVTTDTPTEPEYKFITDEDLSAYEVWCTPHVVAFNPVPTSPLYHYTTGNGLIEIIKSGELWSTQVACLNDSSELLYPIEFLRTKVREKLKSSIATEVEFLLKNIDAGLTEPKIATEGRFIACFSEDGDDLSQWRAYGGGEGGYAIEFDAQYLRQLPEPHKVTILGKVEYDKSKQSLFFDDVLENAIRFFLDGLQKKRASGIDEWTSEFLSYWASLVIMFAPYIKHPRFSGEREWRLVYHFQDEAIPRMRYLQRGSMMTQHVPLRLMISDGNPRLPITGIVVGPCRHKEISRISVGDLLRTYEYSDKDVLVSMTAIPYRMV